MDFHKLTSLVLLILMIVWLPAGSVKVTSGTLSLSPYSHTLTFETSTSSFGDNLQEIRIRWGEFGFPSADEVVRPAQEDSVEYTVTLSPLEPSTKYLVEIRADYGRRPIVPKFTIFQTADVPVDSARWLSSSVSLVALTVLLAHILA